MPTAPKSHAQLMRERHGRGAQDRAYEAQRRLDPRLALAKRLRNSTRWQALRAGFRARNPLCFLCNAAGHTRAGQQVHHVEPLIERPDLAFTETNLRNLCCSCHARIESLDAAGKHAEAVKLLEPKS